MTASLNILWILTCAAVMSVFASDESGLRGSVASEAAASEEDDSEVCSAKPPESEKSSDVYGASSLSRSTTDESIAESHSAFDEVSDSPVSTASSPDSSPEESMQESQSTTDDVSQDSVSTASYPYSAPEQSTGESQSMPQEGTPEEPYVENEDSEVCSAKPGQSAAMGSARSHSASDPVEALPEMGESRPADLVLTGEEVGFVEGASPSMKMLSFQCCLFMPAVLLAFLAVARRALPEKQVNLIMSSLQNICVSAIPLGGCVSQKCVDAEFAKDAYV